MLAKAYREIAERHLQAARLAAQNALPEIAIFHCYHAFESIACAGIAYSGQPIPKTHRGKINRFTNIHRAFPFGRAASAVAATVVPLRNRTLYPEVAPSPVSPAQSFTDADALKLIQRVNGVVRTIARALGL